MKILTAKDFRRRKSDKFQKHSMKNHPKGLKTHNQMQEIIKNATKRFRTESPAQSERSIIEKLIFGSRVRRDSCK